MTTLALNSWTTPSTAPFNSGQTLIRAPQFNPKRRWKTHGTIPDVENIPVVPFLPFLSSHKLLRAPELLGSGAAGNEASSGLGFSRHRASSWKGFLQNLFYFLPQEDLKFLSGQVPVEKPKTLEEFVRFPRKMLLDSVPSSSSSCRTKYPRDPSGAGLGQK